MMPYLSPQSLVWLTGYLLGQVWHKEMTKVSVFGKRNNKDF
jgi:hypothetical protein